MIPNLSQRWPKREVEPFFDKWSENMAYVLGYFAADGSMYRNKRGSCYVAFTSTDKVLLNTVKKIMKASNEVEVYKAMQKNWNLRYTLQIGSKKIFARLLRLGFTPKKSLTLKYPPVPDKLLGHFLRGYFDGDGCATFTYCKRKNRNNLQKVLNIRIRCGNKKFIQTLQDKLTRITHIGKGGLYFQSSTYLLVYSAKDVIKLYSFMYPRLDVPCLKRKRDILIEGLKAFNVGP